MGPTQDLQQSTCQKYGWSLVYSNENGYWRADIVTGWNAKKSFVTDQAYPAKDDKEGKAAVSTLALQGLTSEIARMEALPVQDLSQVFDSILMTHPLEILDSTHPNTWLRFWKDAPSVVGIDTEGNSISPPVLVQISTRDYCILEIPQKQTGLSKDLDRLLKDNSITKVFCDNFSHKDKKALGISIPNKENATKATEKDDAIDTTDDDDMYTTPPLLDLECLMQKYLGPVKTARGLGRIVSLTMPDPQVRIEKPLRRKGGMKGRFANISRFALIEQGKAPPLPVESLKDLPRQQQRYAALDAWCTLAVYERLQQDALLLSRKEDG